MSGLPILTNTEERLGRSLLHLRWRIALVSLLAFVVTNMWTIALAGEQATVAVEKQDASTDHTLAIEPLERRVMLKVRATPVREVLADVCRQAEISLELDDDALESVGWDLAERVTISLENETLGGAISWLIQRMNGDRVTGVYREVQDGRLLLSTVAAKQHRIRTSLPDWLKPFYNRGLVADVDAEGNVTSISSGEAMTDELLAQLKRLPELRELHLSGTESLTPNGLAHLRGMIGLDELSLFDVNHGGNGRGDDAIRSVKGLKSLRKLSLWECGTTDDGVRLLESMPQLTHLTLRQEGRLTDGALVSLGKLKRLKHLDLTSRVGSEAYGPMRFSAEGIRHLAGLQELEELHLVGHAVTADVLDFPWLRSLSLGGSDIDDSCAPQITACQGLTSLTLSYTDISDTGLKRLGLLQELRQLNLDSHVVTDTGIGHLTALPSLRHLNLRASRVTDESLRHLATIKTLVRLELHGSGHPGSVVGERFTMAGLQQLKELPNLRQLRLSNLRSPGGYLGLKEVTQLRTLTLTLCGIRPDELAALQEALPETTIHASPGARRIRPSK